MQAHPLAFVTVVIALALGAPARAARAPDSQADAVFAGGNFYTANPRRPWASAVAIRGDRILQLLRSDQLGSIEVGKRADLVVLDRNLFELDRYENHKARPIANPSK